MHECDSGRARYSIKCMACCFTAQLQGDLARDDASQSLHGSETVASDGVFEQVPRMARNISASATVLFVCGPGAMHGQYRGLTEQSPVDTKDQALRTRYYKHHILHRDVSPTCAVQAWRQSTTLWQAIVL